MYCVRLDVLRMCLRACTVFVGVSACGFALCGSECVRACGFACVRACVWACVCVWVCVCVCVCACV